MKVAAVFVAGQFKFIEVKLIIGISIKNGFAIVAAHNHMLGLAGDYKTRETRYKKSHGSL